MLVKYSLNKALFPGGNVAPGLKPLDRQKKQPNVGKYTMHGSSSQGIDGLCFHDIPDMTSCYSRFSA